MAQTTRIPALDMARTIALLAMAVYHLTLDLEMFGFVPRGTVLSPGWYLFAKLTAGSFLFLAGVSLWLAHGGGLRPRAFWRRIAVIVAAAALVSLATWAAMGAAWIRFGILHSIAGASLVAVLFLRVPAGVTLLAAAAIFAAPRLLDPALFDGPWLLWLGQGTAVPPMLDYEPLLPWAAPCLAGLALARLADGSGWLDALRHPQTPLTRALGWPGRHSLLVYLVHQPVLLSLVWLAARLG